MRPSPTSKHTPWYHDDAFLVLLLLIILLVVAMVGSWLLML